MRRPTRPRRWRRGATLVEAAIILAVFLSLVLGLLDLGVAVFMQQAICQVARLGARQAIVHGQLAPPRRASWGPASYQGTAAATDEIAASIRPALAGLDPSRVTIRVEWPDGGNAVEQPVRVTASTSWTPLVSYLFGGAPRTLSAAATMPIAH